MSNNSNDNEDVKAGKLSGKPLDAQVYGILSSIAGNKINQNYVELMDLEFQAISKADEFKKIQEENKKATKQAEKNVKKINVIILIITFVISGGDITLISLLNDLGAIQVASIIGSVFFILIGALKIFLDYKRGEIVPLPDDFLDKYDRISEIKIRILNYRQMEFDRKLDDLHIELLEITDEKERTKRELEFNREFNIELGKLQNDFNTLGN